MVDGNIDGRRDLAWLAIKRADGRRPQSQMGCVGGTSRKRSSLADEYHRLVGMTVAFLRPAYIRRLFKSRHRRITISTDVCATLLQAA